MKPIRLILIAMCLACPAALPAWAAEDVLDPCLEECGLEYTADETALETCRKAARDMLGQLISLADLARKGDTRPLCVGTRETMERCNEAPLFGGPEEVGECCVYYEIYDRECVRREY